MNKLTFQQKKECDDVASRVLSKIVDGIEFEQLISWALPEQYLEQQKYEYIYALLVNWLRTAKIPKDLCVKEWNCPNCLVVKCEYGRYCNECESVREKNHNEVKGSGISEIANENN
jgi:hypothetical protein